MYQHVLTELKQKAPSIYAVVASKKRNALNAELQHLQYQYENTKDPIEMAKIHKRIDAAKRDLLMYQA